MGKFFVCILSPPFQTKSLFLTMIYKNSLKSPPANDLQDQDPSDQNSYFGGGPHIRTTEKGVVVVRAIYTQ